METNKKEIRKQALNIRKSIAFDEWQIKSDAIYNSIISDPSFIEAKDILIYASYNNEVDTDKIILKALMMGKNIYMPHVDGDDMEFYRVFALDELIPGSYGIREPYNIEHLKYKASNVSICIMPLASFDCNGNRVGYGKGYYDRYLEKNHIGTLIGIAFECQKSNEIIKTNEFDKKLDYVITEENVYKF